MSALESLLEAFQCAHANTSLPLHGIARSIPPVKRSIRRSPARCTIDPVALRTLSHVFSVCAGLLVLLAATLLVFLVRRLIPRTPAHWLFVGISFGASLDACVLAMMTNRDLILCGMFGPPNAFPIFLARSILVASITVLLVGVAIRIIALNRHTDTSRAQEAAGYCQLKKFCC